MTTIVSGIIGTIDETTYGVRVDPTDGDSAVHRLGHEESDIPYPTEHHTIINKIVSTSFGSAVMRIDGVEVSLEITYRLIDGKQLSYIGKVTTINNTVAGDPDYKHQIDILKPSDGFVLDSRTVHIEIYDASGTLLDAIDMIGSVDNNVKVHYNAKSAKGILVTEKFLGQRVTKKSVTPTTNMYGQSSGSTPDPEGVTGDNVANRIDEASAGASPVIVGTNGVTHSLRAGAGYASNGQPFVINKSTSNAVNIGGTIQTDSGTPSTFGTLTSGGTDLKTLLEGFEINIDFTFNTDRVDRPGTNNYNKSLKHYIQYPLVDFVTIGLILQLASDSVAHGLDVDALKNTINNAIYILVEKFNDANDWIAFIFQPFSGNTENIQIDLTEKFPFLLNSDNIKLAYQCKDLVIIVGNAFSTLRAIS